MDDLRKGNCCTRLKYNEYSDKKGLSGILGARAQNKKKGKPIIKKTAICKNNCKNPLASKSKTKKAIKNANKNASSKANYCIDLRIPDEARWRICHSNQDRISQLHMKLIFNTLSANFKGKMSVISNFLSKARVGREAPMPAWNWETQNKWSGQCKSDLMQSPINILKGNISKPKEGLSLKFAFLPTLTMMKRNQKEIITTFMNFAGMVQIQIHGVYSMFTPVYISYRFPGEHVFSGKRYMGEMVIHLAEIGKQRVKNIYFIFWRSVI